MRSPPLSGPCRSFHHPQTAGGFFGAHLATDRKVPQQLRLRTQATWSARPRHVAFGEFPIGNVMEGAVELGPLARAIEPAQADAQRSWLMACAGAGERNRGVRALFG